MAKIILLGDSIRQIGYGQCLQELLEQDGDEVWQPKENCKFAQFTQRLIWDNRELFKETDVVHWNNGHWDHRSYLDGESFTNPQFYVETMVRIAQTLKGFSKRVIFATTTPLYSDTKYLTDANIKKYNALVVPELEKLGVEINDLYSFIAPHQKEYIRSDDLIHLTETGIEACAKEIYDFINKLYIY